jgi:hypothetical protein
MRRNRRAVCIFAMSDRLDLVVGKRVSCVMGDAPLVTPDVWELRLQKEVVNV